MNELNRTLMEKIDKYVEEHTSPMEQENAVKIAEPYLTQLAQENGIDPVDLLVDYLDHVARVSKKMNMDNGEKIFTEEELAKEDFKLY